MAPVSLLFLGGQTLQRCHFTEPLFHGLGRRPTITTSLRHVIMHHTDRSDLRSHTDRQMTCDPALPADCNKIFQFRGTGQTNLRNQHTMAANFDIYFCPIWT